MKLVQNALKVIFDSQMEDGTWRKGEPIFISGAAVTNNHSGSSDSDSDSGSDGGSGSGTDSDRSSSSNNNNKQRDIGNSYVFFFDIIEVTYLLHLPIPHYLILDYYLPNDVYYVVCHQSTDTLYQLFPPPPIYSLHQALMESIASKQPELLSPYLHNLERCVLWAETNVAEEMLPLECDQETNR